MCLCVHFLGECCPSQLKHCVPFPSTHPHWTYIFFQVIPICIMSGFIHFIMGASSTSISKANIWMEFLMKYSLPKSHNYLKVKKTGYCKLKICHGVSSLPLLHLLPWLSTNLSDDLSPVTQTDLGNYIVVTVRYPKLWFRVFWICRAMEVEKIHSISSNFSPKSSATNWQ